MENSISILTSEELTPLFMLDALVNETGAWIGHVPFARWIIDAARPALLVELGTHRGVSLNAFNKAIVNYGLDTKVFAVDTWDGDYQADYTSGSEIFRAVDEWNTRDFGKFSSLMRTTFEQALPEFAEKSIDILHIDGLHTYDAVKNDFQTWLPKMSDRGIVLFHDTMVRREDFGVWRLWEELRARFWGFNFYHSNGLGVLAVGASPPKFVFDLKSIDEAKLKTNFLDRFAFLGEKWVAQQKIFDLSDRLKKQEDRYWRQRGSFGHRLKFFLTGD